MNKPTERSTPDIKTGRIRQAMARYSLGRNTVRSLAQDAGAVVKVGRVCLYDFEKMDAYIDDLGKRS